MPEEVKPVTTISWPKVFLTVLTIVVVAGVIAGALFWYFYIRQPETSSSVNITKPATSSAQKDMTAGWRTYSNETYGFEIKYPKTYQIKEHPKSEDLYHYLAEFSSPPSAETFMSIVVVKDVDIYKNASPKFVAER